MFQFFNKKQDVKILCLGAHSDDIEIGCGGTILKLIDYYNDMDIKWIIFSAANERKLEANSSANLFLKGTINKDIIIKDFRESYFPYNGSIIKDYFEDIKQYNPDVIITHYKYDAHQDHRIISELTYNTFRNKLIIEYEIPKYDGDIGSPNLYITLSKILCEKKINYIINSFNTQKEKEWFTGDTFWSLLRLRGIESGFSNQYAEAFYCRKMVY